MTGPWAIRKRERLLVVNDLGSLLSRARTRYPQYEVIGSSTLLGGVAALAGGGARGLLVGVDPGLRKLHPALAALRKAAGERSRLILCCTPACEPLAREALGAGADDYLIYPPDGNELDKALDLHVPGALALRTPEAEVLPTWHELEALAGVLADLGDGRREMLDRICHILSEAMRAPFVRVEVDETSTYVGDPRTQPILSETITVGGRTLGRLLVGPRQREPFSIGEVEKLRHYARLVAHLIEAAEQQQHWQSLAMIDEATQLPNRRYLSQALESLLHRAAIERFRVTVLLFDLDGFKHFNDAYGHAAGDQVIRETGQLFRKHCRQHDIVARFAGDEFVVVFWDADEPRVAGSKHPTDAIAVLRRVRKALESHTFPKLGPEAVGHITISGGLATFPWDASDAQVLIEKADEAMLRAKRAGKNHIFLVGAEGEAVDVTPPPAQQTSSG